MMSRRRNERTTGTSGSVLFARAFLPSFSPARENNNEKKKIKKKWTEENERRGKRRRRRAAAPGRSRLSSFFSPSLFPSFVSLLRFCENPKEAKNSTKTLNTKIQKKGKSHRAQRNTKQQTARAHAAHRTKHATTRDNDNQSIDR